MSPTTYPVGYEADFAEQRSRLTTFFRLLLAIPLLIVGFLYEIASGVCVVLAWFAIVFTGRYPEGLYRFNARVVRWITRANGYAWLITDRYPPFDLDEHPEYPIRMPIAPRRASYSRAKAFFRILLAIPVMLIAYALNLVLQVSGLISWFWILVTGRQNEGLQNALNLGNAYYGRSSAYYALLTEDWPPFSPGGVEALGPDTATPA